MKIYIFVYIYICDMFYLYSVLISFCRNTNGVESPKLSLHGYAERGAGLLPPLLMFLL